MSRLALYRKYRSADLTDVIGQSHITRTLENALSRGTIVHAYLFTGPRGVGKTSVARILARRLNNLDSQADLAQYMDIIEIDAASNRGIDEIRALRERIASAPTSLPYKVYIIDEVHMLTREAFNALLKTLEEPPSHAIFILATTEAHKLPETIISRTQRFDFRPIQEADLVTHLASIAKQEKITISSSALSMIAHASRGGFRDAISLLDQLSVFEGEIDDGLVYSILGLSPIATIEQIIGALQKHATTEAQTALQSALQAGADPVILTEQLIDELRSRYLLSVKDTKSPLPAAQLLFWLDSLSGALKDFKLTSQYSLPLELALYRITTANTPAASVDPVQSPVQSPTSPTEAGETAPVKTMASTPPSQVIAGDDKARYTKALSYIKTKNNSLYAVMNMAESELTDEQLIMRFNFSFHRDRVDEVKNRRLIEAVMSRVYNRPIVLVCELATAKTAPTDPDTELVSTALEILGGEVVDG